MKKKKAGCSLRMDWISAEGLPAFDLLMIGFRWLRRCQ
jgi:hypothetical protein